MFKKLFVFLKEAIHKKDKLEKEAFSNKYISYDDYKYLLDKINENK